MKKYKVNVNGTNYEITVELANAADVKAAAPAAAAAPAVAAAPAPAAGAETVAAPMPGSILTVNAAAGKSFKKGEVLFILEAMKMENEIMAPRDCTVTAVNTAQGASVTTGEALCTIA